MIDALRDIPSETVLACIDSILEQNEINNHIFFDHYQPNTKQLAFHATGLEAKERAFFAGNRCGKSWAVSAEGSMHLTGNYPEWWNGYKYQRPINMWAAGETNSETKQSLKGYYVGDPSKDKKGFLHPSLILDYKPQENLYYIQHSSGGISTLRFKSYEQGQKKWQAETLDLIHLDEEPPFDIYTEALTRTMSTSPDHYGMLMCSLTPLHGVTMFMLNYMQQIIFDENGAELETRKVAPQEINNSKVYILASHDDSPHLSDQEKARILAAYPAHEREARTKGIPSLGSGLVYPVHESKIVCSPFEIPDYWPRCFGMDFGWTHPTAVVLIAHDQDNDVAYIYGEYSVSQLTPQQHAYELIKRGLDWIPGAYDYAGENSVAVDGGNVVELYERAGIKNWSRADKRSVSKGIYEVLQRMEKEKLKVFSSCNKLLTELRMYARDENGKIKKGNDDLMDAMRYGIETALPKAKTKPAVLSRYAIPVNNQFNDGNWMRV